MQIETLSIKTVPGLYCAWSPDLDLISYGVCQDEALNNLADELRQNEATRPLTGEEKNITDV